MACSGEPARILDGPEPTGQATAAVNGGTVQDAVNAGCSTTSVWGLSRQIVDEVNCLVPSALAAVPDEPNLAKSSSTFAYLQPPAKDALVRALAANTSMTLSVNSMLRTVAQQYLLYAWYEGGLCGIQLAAVPGSSNHEQGLAFDTSDYSAWMSALQSHGFRWFGSNDVVHFDYVGGGAVDLLGKDVLAFQKLWNLNNASDPIAEDGQYGPETKARLQQSPADGFSEGAPCSQPPPPPPPPKDGGSSAPQDAGVAHDAGEVSPDAGRTAPEPQGPEPNEGSSAQAPDAPPDSSSGCSLGGRRPEAPRRTDVPWLLVLALGALGARLCDRRG